MPAARRSRHLELVPGAPAGGGTAAPVAPTEPAVTDDTLPVDVVVLTSDAQLLQATTEAIGERNRTWHATSAEAAADYLVAGHCGVLLIDTASVSAHVDRLIGQIVEQFPDVVVCVAGTRDDEPLLARLISDGLVARFIHKPASVRRAAMFLQVAIRRHRERRGDGARTGWMPLLGALPAPGRSSPARFLGLIGALSLLLTVPVFIGGVPEMPRPQRPASPDAITAAATTAATGSVATPAGVESHRSDPVLSRARAALHAGRLEAPAGRNALDLYQAVLLAQPGHAEARDGLARTVDRVLELAQRESAAGRPDEAGRLVQRVLDVEPGHVAAQALAAQFATPDTPSQQLAREQVATAAVEQDAGEAVLLPPMPPMPPMPASHDAAAIVPAPVAPAPARAPQAPVVQPDPLAPRYAGSAASGRVGTLARPRNYGGRVAQRLPIAGVTSSGDESATATTELAAPVAAPPAPAAAPPVPVTPTAETAAAGGTRALEPLSAPDPVYPEAAMRNGTRGWVELEFTVTPTGAVTDLRVVGAEPRGVFEEAATTALAQWRFRPRVVAGKAVAQRSSVTLRFDLDG